LSDHPFFIRLEDLYIVSRHLFQRFQGTEANFTGSPAQRLPADVHLLLTKHGSADVKRHVSTADNGNPPAQSGSDSGV